MPQLDPAAVPSIFHGAPSYLSTLRTPIRTSPSKRKSLAQEHEECLQENWLDIQKINGYQQLTTNIEMRIRTGFPAVDLVVRQYDSHILVYTLSDAENINRLPTIRFGLRILEDMYMKLLINAIVIHTSQLAWAIGLTNNVLTLWTQLLYRQLSGSNYLVSVKEVMQGERKLKIRGLLRLFTGTRGVVSVKEFVCSFSDIEKGKQVTAFILHSHIVIWTWKLYMCLSCLWSQDLLPKNNCKNVL